MTNVQERKKQAVLAALRAKQYDTYTGIAREVTRQLQRAGFNETCSADFVSRLAKKENFNRPVALRGERGAGPVEQNRVNPYTSQEAAKAVLEVVTGKQKQPDPPKPLLLDDELPGRTKIIEEKAESLFDNHFDGRCTCSLYFKPLGLSTVDRERSLLLCYLTVQDEDQIGTKFGPEYTDFGRSGLTRHQLASRAFVLAALAQCREHNVDPRLDPRGWSGFWDQAQQFADETEEYLSTHEVSGSVEDGAPPATAYGEQVNPVTGSFNWV